MASNRAQLWDAVELNDLDVAKHYIQFVKVSDCVLSDGETLLHGVRSVEMAKLLVENGADVNAKMLYLGTTPLHLAAKNGEAEVVKILISSGADVNVTMRYTGATALHEAAKHGRVEVVKILIDSGADVNAGNEYKETPLYEAVRFGNVEVVNLLISSGADVNARNEPDSTPLYVVARLRNVEIVKILIESGADVNAKDIWGRTPLDFEEVIEVVKKFRFLAIKEELVAAAWHPTRVARWLEAGVLDMMFGEE